MAAQSVRKRLKSLVKYAYWSEELQKPSTEEVKKEVAGYVIPGQ